MRLPWSLPTHLAARTALDRLTDCCGDWSGHCSKMAMPMPVSSVMMCGPHMVVLFFFSIRSVRRGKFLLLSSIYILHAATGPMDDPNSPREAGEGCHVVEDASGRAENILALGNRVSAPDWQACRNGPSIFSSYFDVDAPVILRRAKSGSGCLCETWLSGIISRPKANGARRKPGGMP